ncbi:MAG: hypothetical protein IJV31_04995 [Clostridia bacterium]|nr:hypothetical protein [Clostridia bacterium]
MLSELKNNNTSYFFRINFKINGVNSNVRGYIDKNGTANIYDYSYSGYDEAKIQNQQHENFDH